MSTDGEIEDAAGPLTGKRIAFVGKLGGMTRREAQQFVRDEGALPLDRPSPQADLIVIGADQWPLPDDAELLDDATREAAAAGRLEVITETQLWQRLGLVESEQQARRLYTPAMLAELLHISVATIRRWRRRGLIVPVREVHRLPYFDFQEIATARRLAELVAAGASPAVIERKLAALARLVPEVDRPLAQLSVIVEGRQILLRQDEGLIEPGGQRRIDFDALERDDEALLALDAVESADGAAEPSDAAGPTLADSLGFRSTNLSPGQLAETPDELALTAAEREDAGQIDEAVEYYRAALAAGGPRAEICFHLAELLYRKGDLSGARERYYMTLEIDEDYVEARANLGCLLAEEGQSALAIAAFEGALRFHPDYPDAHYHLARLLDDHQQPDAALEHWRQFLSLAPDSPWSDEARRRLGLDEDSPAN